MQALLVTTPVKPNGLGDFFRFATVQPGHPPLSLPEEEFFTSSWSANMGWRSRRRTNPDISCRRPE
jgi:hypothetical protein